MEIKESDYAKKLYDFNHTRKYRKEFEFLDSLIRIRKGKILDYGCGIGKVVRMMQRSKPHCIIDGYDIEKHDPKFPYVEKTKEFYNAIFFMHSIAHIENPEEVLKYYRNFLFGSPEIVVITPNKEWLDMKGDKNYKADSTVVNHFCQYRLEQLFENCGYSVVNSGQFGERLGNVNERLFLVAEKNIYWSRYGK